MTKLLLRRLGLKLVLLALLALPGLASAQVYFNEIDQGGLYLGFRKTGNNIATPTYEMVVSLGNVTNFLALSAGTVTNITQFAPSSLTDSFGNGLGNLQWSAFATFPASTTRWTNSFGIFPTRTLWFTLPSPSVSTQSTPPTRSSVAGQANQVSAMEGVGNGAYQISFALTTTNGDNYTNLVREPVSYSQYILSTFIGDQTFPTNGDWGSDGAALPNGESAEGITPPSFTAAQRIDLYQVCPNTTVDPINGTKTTPYFIGYFIFNPAGTMTFTRAAAVTAPSAGTVAASVTNGFGPLTVVFTNTASGTISDWVWNFGNGVIITNTTGGDVTNTYAAAGDYTVTLTVYGPGGSATNTVANFIVASPTPKIVSTTANGKIVFTGTNCPVGVKYRILTSTSVVKSLPTWTPVYTNNFASNGTFAYTNSVGNGNAFFILVSP